MAEKTASKSNAKSSAKVFDIAKPGKQAASASARPIIVTNRPIMQDPMVSPAADDKAAADPLLSPSLPKIKIEPLSEDDKKKPAKESKDAAGKPADDEKPEEAATAKPEEADTAKPDASDTPEPEVADDANSDGASTDDSSVEKGTEKPDTADEKAEIDMPAKDETPDEPAGTGSEPADALDGGLKNPDEATAEMEARARKQAALDKLVEEKTYFLPVNAVERHRSKVNSILGLLLIIVLGLALLDIMMDSGVVHIPGVQPVTHFFSS